MAETIIMPTLGLTMTEGTVDLWYKKVGDSVAKGEPVCSISSEKLTNDVEAPAEGVLLSIATEAGEMAACQAVIGVIGQEGEVVTTTSAPVSTEPPTPTPMVSEEVAKPTADTVIRETEARLFVTPLARKIASERGVELSLITGTGGNGRITRRDVEGFVPQKLVAPTTSSAGEGLNGMRKVIAKRMHQSLQQSAQLTLQRKADITALMAFRKDIQGKTSVAKPAMGLNTLLIKAVSLALSDYPEMNAWYGDGQHELVADINMGIAVAVEDGLVVPVLKEVQNASLSHLAKAFRSVTTAAQNGELASECYSGSTFTITNLGQSGVEYFTPILNTPEVGILGVGTIISKLAFNEQREVEEHLELPLSLTFDHQVVDGTPAAEFLKQIVYYLENPYLLVL